MELLSSWNSFFNFLKAFARVTDAYCPSNKCATEAICLKADKARGHGGSCNGDSGGFLGTFEPFVQYAVISTGGSRVRNLTYTLKLNSHLASYFLKTYIAIPLSCSAATLTVERTSGLCGLKSTIPWKEFAWKESFFENEKKPVNYVKKSMSFYATFLWSVNHGNGMSFSQLKCSKREDMLLWKVICFLWQCCRCTFRI